MSKKAAIGDFLPEPEEDVEQISLFRWAAYQRGRWPELELMFHIPNGGKRNKAEAARLKEMGVKAGGVGRVSAGCAQRVPRAVDRDEASAVRQADGRPTGVD